MVHSGSVEKYGTKEKGTEQDVPFGFVCEANATELLWYSLLLFETIKHRVQSLLLIRGKR